MDMETEIKQLKRENETLKRENSELRETNNILKQYPDEAGGTTRPKPAATADTDIELQQQLNRAVQQQNETRQELLNVQERLKVLEQVTAATQRRQLVQEGVFENLPPDSVYEKLRFDPTHEHEYTKLQPHHTGCNVPHSVLRIIYFGSVNKQVAQLSRRDRTASKV